MQTKELLLTGGMLIKNRNKYYMNKLIIICSMFLTIACNDLQSQKKMIWNNRMQTSKEYQKTCNRIDSLIHLKLIDNACTCDSSSSSRINKKRCDSLIYIIFYDKIFYY
jgi:hypothetical protein